MKTRTGKIARLPRVVREQLNRRLQDGELGASLVEWLNALPDTQRVLTAEFGGRAISEQNLSEWKQGGYRDWERHQESIALVRQMTRQSDELMEESGGLEVSHRLAALLSVELAQVTNALLEEKTEPQERWWQLQESLRELAQLRQEDRKTGWLALERARRDAEEDKRAEAGLKSEFNEEKRKILAPIWAKSQLGILEEVFGGGENGRKVAAFVLEVERDLPLGILTGNDWSHSAKPNQTESNPIKPNQTKSRREPSPCTA